MKKTLLSLALGLALPLSGAQAGQTDSQDALNELSASIAAAELSISLVEANSAINEVTSMDAMRMLSASIADAEVTISLVNATEAIVAVERQEAINTLMASIAGAEVSIALADANELVNSVSDTTMLAELNQLLDSQAGNPEELIMATVSERPMLASAVQAMALSSGLNGDMVASAIVGGLGATEATASGK